jgi:tetratricopeptide (TPR) repeat protein
LLRHLAQVRLIPIGILIAAVLASGLVYLRSTADSRPPKGPEPPTSARDEDPSTQNRIERAITELTPAVEAEPTTAEAHQHRGEAWARKAAVDQAAGDAAATTDLDRAIQEFTEAIRLKPELAAAYHGRGDSWVRKGDQDQAIADLNEAIRRNPNDALAYLTRAAAFVSKGQNDLAIVDLTRVIGLATVAGVRLPGSKLVLAYDTRARLYGLKGLDDREAADLGKLIDICIKDPHAVDGGREGGPVTMPAFLASAHVRRAEALLQLRRNADAIADFRKALAIDPDLQKPKDALARLGVTP